MPGDATIAADGARWINILPRVPLPEAICYAAQQLSEESQVQRALAAPDKVDVIEEKRSESGELTSIKLRFSRAHRGGHFHQQRRPMTDQVTVEVHLSSDLIRKARITGNSQQRDATMREYSRLPDILPIADTQQATKIADQLKNIFQITSVRTRLNVPTGADENLWNYVVNVAFEKSGISLNSGIKEFYAELAKDIELDY